MITLALEKCSGCSRCQVQCSFFHFGKVGRSLSRIKVVKLESLGIDFPVVCQQCEEAYCSKCPQEAIDIGPLGQVVVSRELCTACGACTALCPIGAIELKEDLVLVCDLCGGKPQCVDACTMDAIHFEPETTRSVSLKPLKKVSKGLSPEQKRVRYAFSRSEDLRADWDMKRRR